MAGESQEFIDSAEIRTAGWINAAARPTMQGAGEGQEAAGEEVQAPAPGSGAAGEEERVGLAPSRYRPGRLVPPGEAIWAAVEETNRRHFLFHMVG